jgi:cytochrome c oxidase subunit III
MPETASPSPALLRSRLTLRFIGVSVAFFALAWGMAWLLGRIIPPPSGAREVVFWGTTVLLLLGSIFLHRAVQFVRREKQPAFRRSLWLALGCGVLFVAVQTYGLICMIRHQDPAEVQTGANAFLTMLGVLHAMHFSLALLFLIWVALCAQADRYDHEYYWGVTVCGWFWHVLGLLWFLILGVFVFAV